jgi:hypothetical protein
MSTAEQHSHTVAAIPGHGSGSSSVAEFRTFLEGRTKVPAGQVDDFLAWDEQGLEDALLEVSQILRRFADAVADAAEDPTASRDFLRALDLKLISQDHNWRAIFATVRAQSIWSDEHRRLAIKNYLEYLGFRRRLLAFVQEKRASLSQTRAWRFSQLPRPEPAAHGATQAVPGGADAPEGYYRFPNGVPVDLALPVSRTVNVWLAGSRVLLVGSQPPQLVTDGGEHLPCLRDRNLVGRHVSCDVVVPERYVSVSRAHLLVEWRGGNRVTLTDLSSYGTYLSTQDQDRVRPGKR